MTSDPTFDQFFPFHKLGLTKNPFGALTPDEWVAVTVPPPELLHILETGFDHLQIIGERGRGKSTTLMWLCHYLRTPRTHTAYERLPRWHFNYQTDVSNVDVFALDEAQRLFVLNQIQLFRDMQGKQLIIGTHISWKRAFRLRGLKLTTVHIADHTNRDHVRHILDKRLAVMATEQGAQIYFDESAIDYLWGKWRDNLRGMEWFLYHCLQKRQEIGAITADYLQQAGGDYVTPAGLY